MRGIFWLLAVAGGYTWKNRYGCKQTLKDKKPDYLLFTGDFYGDGVQLARSLKVPFAGVRGNSDLVRKGKKNRSWIWKAAVSTLFMDISTG